MSYVGHEIVRRPGRRMTHHPTSVPSLITSHPNDIFPPTEFKDLIEIEGPFEVDVSRVFELDGR
jgi:hypothetical protein